MRIAIIGAGRAGLSFGAALQDAAEISVYGRGEHRDVGLHRDVVLLCVPDRAISDVAARIEPNDTAAIVHVSGATPLSALVPHRRRGSLHPLVSMPDPHAGAQRLRGAWMATAGDPVVLRLAALLDARTFEVDDGDRARYHATAAIAANHLVALLGQVERLAASIRIPPQPFIDLAAGALGNVRDTGAARALTGPVARCDWETLRRHLDALPRSELATYRALASEAAKLADLELPADLR